MPSQAAANSGASSSSVPPGQDAESAEMRKYLPLYNAAIKGDWESASAFIRGNPAAPTAIISIYDWTALHVACSQGHSTFVENLIQQMPREALSLRDITGYTALHYAAKSGRTGSLKCVKALLDVYPELTQIADIVGHVPLVSAAKTPYTACARQRDMVWQLFLVTKQQGPDASPFVPPAIFQFFLLLIGNEYLDIAFYLVKEYPFLATLCTDNPEYYMLPKLIAYVPSAFQSRSKLGFWENIISYLPALERIYEEKSKHIYALELVKAAFSSASSTLNNHDMLRYGQFMLAEAAELGILEIYTTCFEFFPDALWLPPTGSRGALLQTCIKHRQEKILNFFLESMAEIDFMSNFVLDGDSTLHLAAKLAPLTKLKAISGPALQMQSELQWFKVVEKICHPVNNLREDDNQRTAQKVFTEEHKELLESGEKWMKDTANSCMLVATLIATVVFAAAFTVPGGNNQDGLPLFSQKTSFLIFAISDALGLFSSSTSILVFLSILTSRFREEDFLVSLPRKLIIGLASLFFAIVAMMVAFGATLSIVLGHRFPRPWVIIPAVILPACVPVGLFMMLQLPLFIQMVKSTFWSNLPWR